MAINTTAKITITAQVTQAKKGLQDLTKAVQKGELTVNQAAKQWNKYNATLKNSAKFSGQSKKGMGNLWKSIGLGTGIVVLATKALSALVDGFKEVGKATLIAAQIKETGAVLDFVGRKAGFSTLAINKYKIALKSAGIAQLETNQSLLRSIQARVGLANAVKLGRLAQDAATIGLTNSSEAFQRIINAVAKRRPILLRELGILVDSKTAYRKYGEEIGVAASKLTEAQKTQAFINATLDKGKDIAGAYETAMKNVSKRIRSLPRLFQDAQQAVGQNFTPALEGGVTVLEDFLKAVTNRFSTSVQQIERLVGKAGKIKAFSKSILALAKEYDELRNNSSRSTKEQERLIFVFRKLRQSVPDAIIDWENYNDELGINTDIVRQHTEAQEKLILTQLKWQAMKLKDDYKEQSDALEDYNKRLKEFNENGINLTDIFQGLLGRSITGDELQNDIAETEAELAKMQETLLLLLEQEGGEGIIRKHFPKGTVEELKKLLTLFKSIDETGKNIKPIKIDVQSKLEIGFDKELIRLRKELLETERAIELIGQSPGSTIMMQSVFDLTDAFEKMALKGNEISIERAKLDKELLAASEDERKGIQKKIDLNIKAWLSLKPQLQEEFLLRKQNTNAEIRRLEAQRKSRLQTEELPGFRQEISSLGLNDQEAALAEIQLREDERLALLRQFKDANLILVDEFEAAQTAIVKDANRERAQIEEENFQKFIENNKLMTNAIDGFFSGLTSAILNNGKIFKEAVKAMAAAIVQTIISLVAEWVKVKILTAAYKDLAIAKAAAGEGGGGGGVSGLAAGFVAGGPLGLAAAGIFSLFDDPINDAMLRRENRRIARFSAEGIAQGMNEVANRQGNSMSNNASISMGDININVRGNANADTVNQMRELMIEELPQMIIDGRVKVPTTNRRSAR